MKNKGFYEVFKGPALNELVGMSKQKVKTNNVFSILGYILIGGVLVYGGMRYYQEVKKNEVNRRKYY